MELIERDTYLALLQQKFSGIAEGEGHCVFLSGEAGIGKTSVVRTFCHQVKNSCKIYHGTCDALFTPRPLAAFYDIVLQMGADIAKDNEDTDRTALFTGFLKQLEVEKSPVLIVIEDIHWADEATLDFIKFLARRITHVHCLVILTYRDFEVHSRHPLTNVLGQLPTHSFTRLALEPLSIDAVTKLAEEKGYKGEDVYRITRGNPFYVKEILASYNSGIPDNIRDSILSVYNRLAEKTKRLWATLSVLPTGIETKYLQEVDAKYHSAIFFCLELRILEERNGMLSFKHELFRRTIEASLSPFLRIELNKQILELFKDSFERAGEIERLIHHAKNANEYDIVVKYAPVAARKAAALGAHVEASKLYLSAIEYYQGNDPVTLIEFYDAYAYECYLTSQIKEAIIYATKSFTLIKQADVEKRGDCMRLLSRLWWLDGNKKKALAYGRQAVELFAGEPASNAKAMAFSNMSHLKMLSDHVDECIQWSKKAITMAKKLGNENILCHALNNVGTILSRTVRFRRTGIKLLEQSLQIALRNGYEEHVARAYTNIGSAAVVMKDYKFALSALSAGTSYVEERDLDPWSTLMFSKLSRLHFETGNWNEAFRLADGILKNEGQARLSKIDALGVAAKIKMRRGDTGVLPLLMEAKTISLEVMELPVIVPVMICFLEYEWITGTKVIEDSILETIIPMVEERGNIYENSAFAFWLLKSRNKCITLKQSFVGYETDTPAMAAKAAVIWKQLGCPYEQALALFDGTEADKRKALDIIDRAGATAVFEKLKFLMRSYGYRQIPRGIRKSTRSNIANLTGRELDILQLLREGLQNKEIAGRLFISPKTVDHHLSSIFFKLEVNSRTKAVEEALNLNILK
jgi:DNA-binding CsgD family transcriptional regulator/tetratricopeptide (TPR) repeat protein